MATKIGGQNNVKIFVLYLMQNINYPLEFVAVNDIVMRTDYVMYLDFAEAFNEMLDSGLIEQSGLNQYGDPLYVVTEKGRMVAEQMSSDILPKILDEALAGALRYLDFVKRGIVPDARVERMKNGRYDVICELKEKKDLIFSVRLAVDSRDRAERMKNEFLKRPDAIYRSELALISGHMNFLFGESGQLPTT